MKKGFIYHEIICSSNNVLFCYLISQALFPWQDDEVLIKKNNQSRPLLLKYIEEMGIFLLYNYKFKQNQQFPQCWGNIFIVFKQQGVDCSSMEE